MQPSRSDFFKYFTNKDDIDIIWVRDLLVVFYLIFLVILSWSWALPQCFVLNILTSSKPFVCLYSLLCNPQLYDSLLCSDQALCLFLSSVSCQYFKLKCFHILSPPALWKLEVKTIETRCRDASVGKSVPVWSKMKAPPVFPLKWNKVQSPKHSYGGTWQYYEKRKKKWLCFLFFSQVIFFMKTLTI